ncbi:hypothetical protein EAF04_002177 [Stromatinia cepivora]|nr:hypothetical protein EAF04_002177 [Stromatinia cepivora]
MVNRVHFTPEEILAREQNFRDFLEGINFRIPEESYFTLDTFKNQYVAAYAENKRCLDPESYTPSRARIERIIHDKRKLDNDPNASLGKPESFPQSVTMWKYKVGKNYLVEGETVMVKSGAKSWVVLTPFEESFALFAECHSKVTSGEHRGRDATYEATSAKGKRSGLPKNFVMKLIGCCNVCGQRAAVPRKRGREVDGDAEEGPAKRQAEPQPAAPFAPSPFAPVPFVPAPFAPAPFAPASTSAASHPTIPPAVPTATSIGSSFDAVASPVLPGLSGDDAFLYHQLSAFLGE